jgi:hypothetical protein
LLSFACDSFVILKSNSDALKRCGQRNPVMGTDSLGMCLRHTLTAGHSVAFLLTTQKGTVNERFSGGAVDLFDYHGDLYEPTRFQFTSDAGETFVVSTTAGLEQMSAAMATCC